MISSPRESAPSAAGSQDPARGWPSEAGLPRTVLEAVGPLLGLVGAYGSGKTEIAVNLALGLATAGRRVSLADLDLVNPYFRCREAARLVRAAGVTLVVPPGSLAFADLPIVLPEIAGLLDPPQGATSLLDVGGDDVGARALGAFAGRLAGRPYELWQVVNTRRPFSDTPRACASVRAQLESASRLRVTGLVLNSHLGDQTDVDVLLEGLAVGRVLSHESGLPLRALCALGRLADAPELRDLDVPVLRLHRRMLPPWSVHAHDDAPDVLPARRAAPLGLPPKIDPPRPPRRTP